MSSSDPDQQLAQARGFLAALEAARKGRPHGQAYPVPVDPARAVAAMRGAGSGQLDTQQLLALGREDREAALEAAYADNLWEQAMPQVTAQDIYRETGLTPLRGEQFQQRFGHLPTGSEGSTSEHPATDDPGAA